MPENLVSRDGFGRSVPRQPAHLHTQAESFGAYLRDSSRVPRRHSGHSRSSWSAEQGNVYSSVYAIPVASFYHVPGMYVWSTLSAEHDMDEPGVVASPARGHLKK